MQTGRLQGYELGKTLRKRYENYLDDIYNAEDLYAYSSDSERTMSTMQLVLAGLYPPPSSFQWHNTLNWLPISYHYTPARFDVLLKPMLGREFVKIMKRETDHVIAAENVNEYADIIKILEDNYGFNISAQERVDALADVYSTLHSNVS